MLSGKRIILGVTGGIAAYKAAILLRDLQKAGARVRVTITPAAKRFVGVDTFAALSRHDVPIHIFPENRQDSSSWTQHISWGEWADLFIMAPCTANTLAKIAHGLSDNMLTATVLAAHCPLLICPTMDGEMYQAPATQRNLKLIDEFGYQLLEPEEGYLASGQQGKGRLPEPDVIIKKAEGILSKKKVKGRFLRIPTNSSTSFVEPPHCAQTDDNVILSAAERSEAESKYENPFKKSLTGKKVVVTAGPTREHLDPVRFISNPSSGKMGFAMAEAARDLGGNVTVLHGPVALDSPSGVKTEKFQSTADLFSLMHKHADADVIIMAAAVADFTPAEYHDHKIKKDDGSSTLPLKSTPDILQWLGNRKQKTQTLIGFAMETEHMVDNARKKLAKKHLNWIIANELNDPESGFEVDTNRVQLINKKKTQEISGSKREVAKQVLGVIFPSVNLRESN